MTEVYYGIYRLRDESSRSVHLVLSAPCHPGTPLVIDPTPIGGVVEDATVQSLRCAECGWCIAHVMEVQPDAP